MFCSACCRREQPVALVVPENPTKSESDSGPFPGEPGEANDPFLHVPASKLAEEKVSQPVKQEPEKVETKESSMSKDPKEFKLVLDRSDPAQLLGALFDASMSSELYVSTVLQHAEGLVQNAERVSGVKLKPGDFIISVNGVTGSDMPKELQTAKRLELTVRRPTEYHITISKTSGTLGCSITYDANTGNALGIASVLEGPIQSWNARGMGETVRVGDRIVGVNGKRGYTSQLLEAIHAANELNLCLARPCDP